MCLGTLYTGAMQSTATIALLCICSSPQLKHSRVAVKNTDSRVDDCSKHLDTHQFATRRMFRASDLSLQVSYLEGRKSADMSLVHAEGLFRIHGRCLAGPPRTNDHTSGLLQHSSTIAT